MKKNYYDILQINKNASPEIIEKAYKTLAKKYHPDLQPEENKKHSEEILKDINKAYEILSNYEKRRNYDIYLKDFSISEEDYQDLYTQNRNLKDKLNSIYENQNNDSNFNNKLNNKNKKLEQTFEYQEELQRAKEKAYHDAYIQDLKNRGYKIKYKKTFKDYLRGIFSILIIFVILVILWHIPFIKNFFVNIYNENEILHYLVDFFLNIVK